MTRKRIAVIGCGAAVRRYYLPAFKSHRSRLEEVHLIDSNLGNAEEIREELGWGRAAGNYHDLFDRIHGAIVAVPHFLHHRVVLDFLNAGIPVLCEKPLAEDIDQAAEMIRVSHERKVPLCVNNTRRLFPAFIEIKRIIGSGELGRPLSIRYTEGNSFAWPSRTGFYVDPSFTSKGVLLDIGSHVMDTICWWLGSKPDLKDYQDDSSGGPESLVKISAAAGACTIHIVINRLCDLENAYEIRFEHGRIQGKIFSWNQFNLFRSGKTLRKNLPGSVRSFPGFVSQVFRNFLGVLDGTEKPCVPGDEAVHSIAFIDECYEKRKEVKQRSEPGKDAPFALKAEPPPALRPGKILVTGASGFIGCRVVETLHLSGFTNVTAAVRQWSSAARLGRMPVDITFMDLLDRSRMDRALEGVTTVIHCAKGTPDVTVGGTRNLLDASLKHGVKRFIHLSTAEVYGNVCGTIREDTPFQYTGNEYNRMKIDAEKICWEYHEKGLPVTCIRPSIVYGPFSSNWTTRFARMLLKGQLGIYETYGEGMCNLVFVDDLVRAILKAAAHENAIGQAFNINGPETVSWNEYFKRFNSKMGLPPLRTIKSRHAGFRTALVEPVRRLGGFVRSNFMAPVRFITEYVPVADRFMRGLEHSVKMTFSKDEFMLLNKKAFFSGKKSENLLGFIPKISVDDGLEETLMWLKEQGIM
jgi:nucleoside-diphosphate-sugar epimerase/predicted dehydrogenase